MLSDNVKALEWYHDYYLDLFGGSRKKISLFGESAGAMSIHYLLISEKNYLFNRVLLQSSSAYLDLAYRTPEDSYMLSKVYIWSDQRDSKSHL